MCGENNHVQGILHPVLCNRAEICILCGQAGLQTLNELSEQTLSVQKWQKATDHSNVARNGNLQRGLACLIPALILCSD